MIIDMGTPDTVLCASCGAELRYPCPEVCPACGGQTDMDLTPEQELAINQTITAMIADPAFAKFVREG